MESQTAYAKRLSHELQQCGDDDVTSIDILDALASSGLRLEADPDANASAAYRESLTTSGSCPHQ